MISKSEIVNILFVIIVGSFLILDSILLQKFFPSLVGSYGNSHQPNIIVNLWLASPIIGIISIIKFIFIVKNKNTRYSLINQALAFPFVALGIILLVLFILEFSAGVNRIMDINIIHMPG